MSVFNGRIADAAAEILGDSISRPLLMNLGNPLTGEVEIALTDAESPNLVWVHARTGNQQILSGNPALADDDKQTATRALLLPNKIPPDLLIYGTPVYVKTVDRVLQVIDLGGVYAAEYLYNLKNRPQRSVDISQLDYALIRPTSPPSPKILMSPFRPTLNSTAYNVPALLSVDLIDAYYGALQIGRARAIKIEVDPAAATLHYEQGSAFTDTSHALAFATYYPKTVTPGRYLLGWVKLYYQITAITVTDIYPAQEIFSKDSISGFTALAAIITAGGEVVISDGQVTWSE